MSGLTRSPKLLKGGIILMDPVSGAVQRVIALQYNPELLTRTLTPQGAGGTSAPSQPLRLKGPPIETFKLDAEIDATDQLAAPDQNTAVLEVGLHPQLAVLETLVYPDSAVLIRNNTLASLGTLEIVPAETLLTLFVWSKERVVPVRLTDFSIVEEAFDSHLNPIRARVSLGMRVLNINDLGFGSKAGHLYMVYHQGRERLAKAASSATQANLGLGSLF